MKRVLIAALVDVPDDVDQDVITYEFDRGVRLTLFDLARGRGTLVAPAGEVAGSVNVLVGLGYPARHDIEVIRVEPSSFTDVPPLRLPDAAGVLAGAVGLLDRPRCPGSRTVVAGDRAPVECPECHQRIGITNGEGGPGWRITDHLAPV